MNYIRAASEYGIVVRRASLTERQVPWDKLLAALEATGPLDANDQIASFGPHFGRDAQNTFIRRLSALGLQYLDDFFEFSGDFPSWCVFGVCAVQEHSQRA
jgi:hypothetical protein